MNHESQLNALIAQLVAQQPGLDVEEVSARRSASSTMVTVLVDRDGGVTLQELGDLSETLSEAIDEAGVLGDENWSLEVSSPGVDRPLTEPRHWRRNVGRLVDVALREGSSRTGRITAADEDAAEIQTIRPTAKGVKPKPGPLERIPYGDVARAVVQVEFNPASPNTQTDPEGEQ